MLWATISIGTAQTRIVRCSCAFLQQVVACSLAQELGASLPVRCLEVLKASSSMDRCWSYWAQACGTPAAECLWLLMKDLTLVKTEETSQEIGMVLGSWGAGKPDMIWRWSTNLISSSAHWERWASCWFLRGLILVVFCSCNLTSWTELWKMDIVRCSEAWMLA